MKVAKPRKWPLIFMGPGAVFVIVFLFHMYRSDIRALKGFMASYDRFDRAISFYIDGGGADALGKAGEAVIELQTRSNLRISSLIKNDSALMAQAREVADLSRRELESLRAVAAGLVGQNPEPNEAAGKDKLYGEIRTLHEKRKAAYARFEELGGAR